MSLETIHLKDYLDDGIIREAAFRERLADTDWSVYDGRRVLIKGCSDVPIPTWAYMMVTSELSQHADTVLYGEACAAVNIFKRKLGAEHIPGI